MGTQTPGLGEIWVDVVVSISGNPKALDADVAAFPKALAAEQIRGGPEMLAVASNSATAEQREALAKAADRKASDNSQGRKP